MKITNHWRYGIFCNIAAAAISFVGMHAIAMYLTPQNAQWAHYTFGLTGAGLSFWYFGWEGLRKIEVGWNGVPLFLGKRKVGTVLDEGLVWYWPKPFGNIQQVETKKKSIDQEVTEILSRDDVAIRIDLSSEIQIVDPEKYLGVSNADDLFRQAIDGVLRLIISKLNSETAPRSKVGIVDVLINGTKTGQRIPGIISSDTEEVKELEDFTIEGVFSHALTEWGIKLNKVRITAVRLPPEVEAARANVRVEFAQQEAERKETETVLDLMRQYKKEFPNLSDKEIAAIVQAERGKRTVVTIDGNADPLIQAGALAGGITNKKQ